MTYEDIIDEILESEGAEVNEADGKDKDGNPIPSKFGVLQTTLNWFHRVKDSAIPTSVYDLTDANAREFYQWWVGERSGAKEVPSWLSYMLADFYTQSGGWAIKILQKKAGVDEDGAWGPNTKQAVGAMFDKLEAEIEANPHADNEFREMVRFRKALLYPLTQAGRRKRDHGTAGQGAADHAGAGREKRHTPCYASHRGHRNP